MSADMDEILDLGRQYAEARRKLLDLASVVQEAQRQVLAAQWDYLIRLRDEAKTCEDALQDALQRAPALFSGGKDTPRTRTVDGVKIGYQKHPGTLEWGDAAQVVAAIRKHMPEAEAACLIRVKEEPIRQALKGLPVKTLARLGVRLTEDDDQIVIKPVNTDMEKVLKAMLSDEPEEQA